MKPWNRLFREEKDLESISDEIFQKLKSSVDEVRLHNDPLYIRETAERLLTKFRLPKSEKEQIINKVKKKIADHARISLNYVQGLRKSGVPSSQWVKKAKKDPSLSQKNIDEIDELSRLENWELYKKKMNVKRKEVLLAIPKMKMSDIKLLNKYSNLVSGGPYENDLVFKKTDSREVFEKKKKSLISRLTKIPSHALYL